MVFVHFPSQKRYPDAACSDLVFVTVVRNSDRFPGGYHLLVISNMIDGLLGGKHSAGFQYLILALTEYAYCVGFSTAVATSHAYVSDCVAPTER